MNETLSRQERFTLALAGGATPRLLYSRLAREPYRSAVPWSRLWIFWGDERCVPPDHPDSNFRMADETLLSRVPVPPTHVFRMRGEDPPPQAARDYEALLKAHFRGEARWPSLDLILLGLGADGHTASLIADSPALTEWVEQGEEAAPRGGDRWVVGNVIRSLQTVRITLTLPSINYARNAWFLVTGSKKAEAFARARRSPDPACPASLVQPESGNLRWYVDRSAARSGEPAK